MALGWDTHSLLCLKMIAAGNQRVRAQDRRWSCRLFYPLPVPCVCEADMSDALILALARLRKIVTRLGVLLLLWCLTLLFELLLAHINGEIFVWKTVRGSHGCHLVWL